MSEYNSDSEPPLSPQDLVYKDDDGPGPARRRKKETSRHAMSISSAERVADLLDFDGDNESSFESLESHRHSDSGSEVLNNSHQSANNRSTYRQMSQVSHTRTNSAVSVTPSSSSVSKRTYGSLPNSRPNSSRFTPTVMQATKAGKTPSW